MDIAKFMTAGNATFTVTSKSTGARFTYKVRESDTEGRYFVSVLTGPDNTRDYSYAGMFKVRGSIFTPFRTKASKVSEDAPSWKGFCWLVRNLDSPRFDRQAEVHHEGRCGRCGRALTVPESIESGFGPECITKV